MNNNVILQPTISSLSTKRTITEKDTSFKRFCNNLQWVHSKSKDCKPRIKNIVIKKMKMSSQGHQSWLRSPMSSQACQIWLWSPMSSEGSQIWLRSAMSSQGSQAYLRSTMSSQGSQIWLRSHMSSHGSQTWLSSPMSSQGSQTWLRSPMPEQGDPCVRYIQKSMKKPQRWSESMNRKKDRQPITK